MNLCKCVGYSYVFIIKKGGFKCWYYRHKIKIVIFKFLIEYLGAGSSVFTSVRVSQNQNSDESSNSIDDKSKEAFKVNKDKSCP